MSGPAPLQGQEKFGPGDAIVSIDGDPVLLGELNYLLTTNLRVKDLSVVPINVQQASSALLVKRHLAMKSLRQDGGEGLQRILDGEWSSFVNEIRGKGETLESFCRQKLSNEDSVRKSHDWDVAWRVYLKSKMTDANLRRFYQRDPEKYASAAWKVSHIFLPIDDDNADAKAIAEQRMERIVAELAGEADQASRLASRFKELAISESDGATAKQGGAIGWVSKAGDLPASVMDAIRETPAGSMTKSVESPLGLHLALVHEKSTQEIPFDQITDLGPLRRDAAEALFAALVARNANSRIIWYLKQLRPPTE